MANSTSGNISDCGNRLLKSAKKPRALAGSLEQQGLFLGDVNTAAPWNRRGNRESFAMMDFQTAILEAQRAAIDSQSSQARERRTHCKTARRLQR